MIDLACSLTVHGYIAKPKSIRGTASGQSSKQRKFQIHQKRSSQCSIARPILNFVTSLACLILLTKISSKSDNVRRYGQIVSAQFRHFIEAESNVQNKNKNRVKKNIFFILVRPMLSRMLTYNFRCKRPCLHTNGTH